MLTTCDKQCEDNLLTACWQTCYKMWNFCVCMSHTSTHTILYYCATYYITAVIFSYHQANGTEHCSVHKAGVRILILLGYLHCHNLVPRAMFQWLWPHGIEKPSWLVDPWAIYTHTPCGERGQYEWIQYILHGNFLILINVLLLFALKSGEVIITHWAAMHPSAPYLFFYLSNARRFYSSMGKLCSLMG